jgi:hypothetical protein
MLPVARGSGQSIDKRPNYVRSDGSIIGMNTRVMVGAAQQRTPSQSYVRTCIRKAVGSIVVHEPTLGKLGNGDLVLKESVKPGTADGL